MAPLPSAIIFLIGSISLTSTAAAQAPSFAKKDYASNSGTRGMVLADFNRDGWLDVAHANISRNSVTILLNRAGVSLARSVDIPVGAGPFALATADFNRDAVPDLAVTNADGDSISILLGAGDGSFTRTDIAAPAENPRGITAADVNHDGRPDVIYTGYATGTVQVLLGNGAGGFVKGATFTAAGTHPQGIVAGDFNHDRFPDLAVAFNNAGGLRMLFGTSTGAFTRRTIPGPGNLNVLAAGDLNGDGWLDLAAASTGSSDVDVYLGGASGLAFSRAYDVGISPRGVALGDVNGDGRVDVITANRGSSTVSLLRGDPVHPGTFLEDEEIAASRGSRAVTLGDVNGDGRLDIVVGNEYIAAVSVLSNITALTSAAFSFRALTLPSETVLDGEGFREPRSPRIIPVDVDRDGRLDFVTPGTDTSDAAHVVVMLRNGKSVVLAGPAPMTGFLVEDLNGDGNVDVLLYSTDGAAVVPSTRMQVHLGDGRGTLTALPAAIDPHSFEWCAAGDMNRDGRLDLVCDNLVILGNGNGTFRSSTAFDDRNLVGGFPGPLLVDVNRDGKLDMVNGTQIYFGDGAGGLHFGERFGPPDDGFSSLALAAADLNGDGYVDFVLGEFPDVLDIAFGSAAGFQRIDRYFVLEDYDTPVIADVNMDGHPDIVLNAARRSEDAGILTILFGDAGGTFERQFFALAGGPVLVAELTGDALPDIAGYDSKGVHVLVNERNDVNHAPRAPNYSVSLGYPCVSLEMNATDPDQHALVVQWFDSAGTLLTTGLGAFTSLNVCVTQPGTFQYRRTVTDGRGGTASGIVTFTYRVTLKEIVLYAAADSVEMTGNWSRLADATAAGGFAAHDRNLGAPKVLQPSASPANSITIPFIADPNLTNKLWLRLKADGNSFANDSVWVQFSGGLRPPFGDVVYRPGTAEGLSVSLEECVNCGVAGWGWQDDGFGAMNKNGVLLRFEPGPQVIVIQTREDGVSVDQIVLSAEKYLTAPPGPAKNDHTILPSTAPR